MTLTSQSLLSKQVCSPSVLSPSWSSLFMQDTNCLQTKGVNNTVSLSVIWFESVTGVFKHSQSGDYRNKLVCMCVTKTTNNSLYFYCGRSFWFINSLISTPIPVQVFPTLIPSPIKGSCCTFLLSFWIILSLMWTSTWQIKFKEGQRYFT